MDCYMEFGGGLGDIFFQIFAEGGYRRLDALDHGDRARVALISHNPYVGELFLWHPRASQIELRDLGYWLPEEDAEMRRRHGLPAGRPSYAAPPTPVTFYPAPPDVALQDALGGADYVVFAASAGLPDRNLPDETVRRLAAMARARGLLPVFVGRTYPRHHRHEDHPPAEAGLDLIDRLSVPGVARLLAGAAALVCCHSALNMLGWLMRKPQLLLYPEAVRARHIAARDQWAFGVDFPECRHATFDDPEIGAIADELFGNIASTGPRAGSLVRAPATPRVAPMIPLPAECRAIELDETIPRLTSAIEVKFLCWLARETEGNVVELGCNKGLTTRDLARSNPGKIIYAVDNFATRSQPNDWQRAERPSPDDFCVHARELENVVVLHGDTARLNYDALRDVRLVFIDGDHTFEAVRADTERARAHLERTGGGWLVWHDYYVSGPFWVGVRRYVDTLDLAVEQVADTWLAIARIGPLPP